MEISFITVIGFSAAFLTTVAFIPQAYRTVKTRHTKDLSLGMYLILNSGIILWFIYGFVRKDYPVIVANGVTLLFTLTILAMKLRFR